MLVFFSIKVLQNPYPYHVDKSYLPVKKNFEDFFHPDFVFVMFTPFMCIIQNWLKFPAPDSSHCGILAMQSLYSLVLVRDYREHHRVGANKKAYNTRNRAYTQLAWFRTTEMFRVGANKKSIQSYKIR